jgi:hypothetical protein
MNMPAIALRPLPLLVLLPIAGCAGVLARAESEFTEGRYPDAKQAFVSLEAASTTWGDAKRAEYCLYRGLTHAALGDRAPAAVWLREAKAIVDSHPMSLSRGDMVRLKTGLDGLGAE